MIPAVAPLPDPQSRAQDRAAAQGPVARTPADERRYRLADLAQHADAKSCWMAIDGVVYDFTAYLPEHPADPAAMLGYCGGEASTAFRTKDAGRPHSSYARRLLAQYRIGMLAP